MPDRPILGNDARLYLKHVGNHSLRADTQWLVDVGRFPVGCCVLDVGCGTGTLVAALAGDKRFARSVIGVELSPELADHASKSVWETGGKVYQDDIFTWTPPIGWKPDTMVMSYFLHHCEDTSQHFRRAADLLPHGGRLYILARIACDESALAEFPRYWEDHYRGAHEWAEEMPSLSTVQGLIDGAATAGFDFVHREVCPHDSRKGAEGFPKTLMEFWRHEPGRVFPAVLVVSPAHEAHVDEICEQLALENLTVVRRLKVPYSDDLIRTIYERCPWREPLLEFVSQVCPRRIATALPIKGDDSVPDLLNRLSLFKKNRRCRWKNIVGPIDPDGVQAIILPFHVAEPYEAEALARVVGLSTGGR
jgi:SAM-dependent methyltransferase